MGPYLIRSDTELVRPVMGDEHKIVPVVKKVLVG